MLPSIQKRDVWYYIGAGYDLINPLINTECRRLVCVDLVDQSYFPPLSAGLVLPEKVKRGVHIYGVLNRFIMHWRQLSDANPEFGPVSELDVRGNRLEISVSYKTLQREIVFYSGVDGNDIPWPKEIRGRKDLGMYISMGHVKAATIDVLRPVEIIVFHTALNSRLRRRVCRAVFGPRIDPFSPELRIFEMQKYLIFG